MGHQSHSQTVPPTPASNFYFRSRWEDQGPRLAGAKTTFVLATHYRCTLCIIIDIHKPCDYVPQSLQFMEITTTDECNKLIHKQCHIICMTSYAQHHLHHILLIMSYLWPWVCPTSTLSVHDMVPGDTSSHFYSIEVSSLWSFFTKSRCTNIYPLIATYWLQGIQEEVVSKLSYRHGLVPNTWQRHMPGM